MLNRVLAPANLRKLQDRFHREAKILVDRVVTMGSFACVRDFSTYYPLKVFCDAVGVPEAGRENVLAFSSMVLNSRGPSNALAKAAFANAGAVSNWIMATCARTRSLPMVLGPRSMQLLTMVSCRPRKRLCWCAPY